MFVKDCNFRLATEPVSASNPDSHLRGHANTSITRRTPVISLSWRNTKPLNSSSNKRDKCLLRHVKNLDTTSQFMTDIRHISDHNNIVDNALFRIEESTPAHNPRQASCSPGRRWRASKTTGDEHSSVIRENSHSWNLSPTSLCQIWPQNHDRVVPCREHFVLFYLISFLYFIYVGSNLRKAGRIFPAEQTGRLDHLSLT